MTVQLFIDPGGAERDARLAALVRMLTAAGVIDADELRKLTAVELARMDQEAAAPPPAPRGIAGTGTSRGSAGTP